MKVNIQRDGLNLVGELTTPDSDNYNLVILMHGFTGNKDSDLHLTLANALRENGVASLRFDFNGHGESDGLMRNMTIDNEIADGKAVLDYVKTLPEVNDIYLLGHSQGGVVASMLAGYYPADFKKLVLMAPAATLKTDAQQGRCIDATFDPHNIPNEVVVNGYDIDGFYFRTAQQVPIYEVASHYNGEVLLIHGDSDTVVDPVASKTYHEKYQHSTLEILPGATHSFDVPYLEPAVKKAVDFITAQ
ncbi:MAG: alpha/beta fold hydrolase [Aerococcus sp.]|nr:alpha/beta fold hydrolase [Aerococcus sp.]